MPIQHSPTLIAAEEFKFLGQRGLLADCGWDGPAREKLWRYNQHYFDDLNAISASERYEWHLNILRKWVSQNPPAIGVGWEPYPTSLRMVNWIKWTLSGNSLSIECINSLAIQARLLSRRIERHLLGNHILANAKALIFAGLFFQGDEADCWLKDGLKILELELPEQILQDGGHFELSPMYHSIVLEDLLDLINASQMWAGQIKPSIILSWKDIVRKMLIWLQKMTHPDGEITFFNDAAFNIAASLKDLSQYAQSLTIQIEPIIIEDKIVVNKLLESGYVQIKSNSAVAFLDVAAVGPDYLPGHAHADSLSFELSVFEHRIVVNGGTSCYGVSSERLRQRQTAAHSTVEVDETSSSEVWGGFRVARRAKPFNLIVEANQNQVRVDCSHNGYERLKGRPIHRRLWEMSVNELNVTDWLVGGDYKSVSRFIFHPKISIEKINDSSWHIVTSSSNRVLVKIFQGRGVIEVASYAPEFGKVLQTKCLAVELFSDKSQVKFQW